MSEKKFNVVITEVNMVTKELAINSEFDCPRSYVDGLWASIMGNKVKGSAYGQSGSKSEIEFHTYSGMSKDDKCLISWLQYEVN